jgi:hypothetical protein
VRHPSARPPEKSAARRRAPGNREARGIVPVYRHVLFCRDDSGHVRASAVPPARLPSAWRPSRAGTRRPSGAGRQPPGHPSDRRCHRTGRCLVGEGYQIQAVQASIPERLFSGHWRTCSGAAP